MSAGTEIIKIDTTKAVAEILNYTDSIAKLRAEQKELQNDIKELTKAEGENSQAVQFKRAQIVSLEANIKSQTAKLQSLQKATKAQVDAEKSHAGYIEAATEAMNSNIDSIAKATEANRILREAVKNITDAEDADRSIRQKLNAAIDENTAYIKRNSDSYVQQKMTIGDYREQVKLAMVELKNGGMNFQSCGIVAKQFANIMGVQMKAAWANATAGSMTFAKGLNIVKVAMMAIPVFAIIAAITALVAMFKRTQAGAEKFSQIMASLGAILDIYIDRMAKFGEAVYKLFTGDIKGAAQSYMEIFKGLGDELVSETKKAWDLRGALNQIEKAEAMLGMRRAASKAQISELRKLADDTTKSNKERLEAAEKAYRMEQEGMSEEIRLQEERIANALGFVEVNEEVKSTIQAIKEGAIDADEAISRLGLSNSTLDDLKEFATMFNKLNDLQTSSMERQKELQNKQNSIQKESREKAKAARDKEYAEIRKAEDALFALVKDGREKQAEEIRRNYSRQIEDLKNRLKQETDLTKAAREAINTQITALEQKQNDELTKLSEEQIRKDIDARARLIELELEAVKRGSDEELQLRLEQLSVQRAAELAEKELTEEMKAAITEKYARREEEIREEAAANERAQAEKIAQTRLENEIMQMQQSGASELEILNQQAANKLEALQSLQQMEGESTDEFLNRQLKATEDYTEAKRQVSEKETEIEQTKMEAIAKITNGLSSLLESMGDDNTAFAKLSKVLALGEIAVNTGKAIAAGVAQAQSVPFPGNLAAIATTIATIMTNVTTAIKTVKSAKFATGGLVTGPGTGTSDSIQAQLSNGESVMTAKATSMFAPVLSTFNQIGGGVPIQVTQTATETTGEEMMARAFTAGVAMLPNPVVSVQEVVTVQKRVQAIETLANI